MSPGLKKFIKNWLITAFAVLVAVAVMGGHIRYREPADLLVAALLLGVLNAFIRPVMLLLALPLVIVTLGLFTIVINACLLYLVHGVMGSRFEVDSFGWAMLGAVVISVISLPLNILTGNTNTTVKIQRRTPPKDSNGDGPVIDV
jgi:putative membrane protein